MSQFIYDKYQQFGKLSEKAQNQQEQIKEDIERMEQLDAEKEQLEQDIEQQMEENQASIDEMEQIEVEASERAEQIQAELDQSAEEEGVLDFLWTEEQEVDMDDFYDENDPPIPYEHGLGDELMESFDDFFSDAYEPTTDPEEIEAAIAEQENEEELDLFDFLFGSDEPQEMIETKPRRDYTPISIYDHRETYSDKEMKQIYDDIHAYQHNIYNGDTYIGDKEETDRPDKDTDQSVEIDI